MTYRERRERRIERLNEWAEKRIVKSDSAYKAARELGRSVPFGQPILVGHHSEGKMRRLAGKIDSNMRQSVEHQAKAAEMQSTAANIASALNRSIYSDDADAIEQLEARIAGLEAKRDSIKAHNLSCRQGRPDASLVRGARRREAEDGRFMAKNETFPPYVLSNLNGNITRNRKRLEMLKRKRDRLNQA